MATTNRFTPGAGQDNTFRTVTQDAQTPAYAASIAITTVQQNTTVIVGMLIGALTLTAGVGTATTAPYVGDKLEVLFSSDANVGGRVVTFSTGLAVSASTLTVAQSKYAVIEFKFNGTVWVETNRTATV